MTFLQYVQRRKWFFISYGFGYVGMYCIMQFFGFSTIPVTGATILALAAGILLLGPAVEYCWQNEREKP